MRPDRLLTLKVVQPCCRVASRFRSLITRAPSPARCLPVLMYHRISDDPEPGLRPYYRVCTSPQRFREQMQWLKQNDCLGVTLSEGLAWLGETRKPEIGNLQPVAITFDDGFRDFYTEAFPALQRQGFTATMFLPTAFINQSRRRFNNTDCLTWDEVRELRQSGMQFGSHTINHPRLVDLAWPEIESELRGSKIELEQLLGEPVTTFAYPFAFPQADPVFRQTFRALLAGAGYDCCVTTEIGRVKPGDDPYCLKRLPVNSLDDAAMLQAKLAGHYDWLARPQKLIKQLKLKARAVGQRRSLPGRSSGCL